MAPPKVSLATPAPLATFACLFLLFSSLRSALADSSPRAHDFARWQRLIRRELDGIPVGGYAYEILQHGKIVVAGAHGYARAPWEKVDPAVPFTLEKLAPIASVSKTITAVALLRLWDEKNHRFSLDDPVWPIIRRIVPNPNPAVKQITIRQVLMHSAGFKSIGDISTHQELASLLQRPLVRRPGAKFDYHNNNYYLARVIIEELSGQSYPRYVRNHVLAPMGITDMATRAERRCPMCGYGDSDGPRQPGYPFDWDCTQWVGGAGWYGSVNDLAKFMRGLREGKVLSAQAAAILFRDALGFDWEDPGFGKAGDWVNPDPQADGEIHSAVCYFPDDIEAALVINAPYDQGPLELLEDTWTGARKKPVPKHRSSKRASIASAGRGIK